MRDYFVKSICVYLGANSGHFQDFNDAAISLGKEIGSKGLTLIYGGSGLGMMGLARSVKEYGGKIIGVITKKLIEKEEPLTLLDELHIVETMHERKALMHKLAELFIVMPGGLGTLEEAFETWNAIKIGCLDKPIRFLNINGYFNNLFTFMDSCEKNGFLLKTQQEIPSIHADVCELLKNLIRTK